MMSSSKGIESPDEWEEQQKAIRETLKKAAKNTDSKILKKVAKDKAEEPEMRKKMVMLSILYHETCEMIESGQMKFNEAIDDFALAAKEID